MAKNKRVAKEVIKYSLRIEPETYSNIQKNAEDKGLTMNALLNKIIDDFIKDEKLTSVEQLTLEQIKSLPLKEQKAILKKLSTND
jgi:predicted DNA-binding ribbon-helix-helix protein